MDTARVFEIIVHLCGCASHAFAHGEFLRDFVSTELQEVEIMSCSWVSVVEQENTCAKGNSASLPCFLSPNKDIQRDEHN